METDEHLCMRAAELYRRDVDNGISVEAKEIMEDLVCRLGITKDVCDEQHKIIEKAKDAAYADELLGELYRENVRLKEQLKDKLGLSPRQRRGVDDWIKEHEAENTGIIHSYRYLLSPMGDSGRYLCVKVMCSCGKDHIVM